MSDIAIAGLVVGLALCAIYTVLKYDCQPPANSLSVHTEGHDE